MIRAVTVCVGYDDMLSMAIPSILGNVESLCVVTTPSDEKTKALCKNYDRIKVLETESFYAGGAKFRKGLAIEESLDLMGRRGWILTIDSDIILPPKMNLPEIQIGKLYSPCRRILDNPKNLSKFQTPDTWGSLKKFNDNEFAGYFHLFHADDPAIKKRPWYGIDWMNAAGYDSVFEKRWNRRDKIRPDFEVLHLGPTGVNWDGRITGRYDENA